MTICTSIAHRPTPMPTLTMIHTTLSRNVVGAYTELVAATAEFDSTDLDVFVEAVKFVRNLGRISPFSDIIGSHHHPIS